ncbi:class I SAM-dependent methyltransferase [Magnetovibrio sp. PR-2]|uniref:SAM-dependent methyltransferase n=1 Tax=Magnetovibrio sp. PR-2 TaxID=3120356 RepID=UPI002FCE4312
MTSSSSDQSKTFTKTVSSDFLETRTNASNALKQFDNPFYSTQKLESFLKEQGCLQTGKKVLDMGCGYGAYLSYFGAQNPDMSFVGIDYNQSDVELGNQLLKERNIDSVELKCSNWFDLDSDMKGQYDGVMSVHTLCCFKDIDEPISKLCELSPRWIALNSLFYDGPLDVLIHIRGYDTPWIEDDDPDGDFNIFSFEKTAKIFERYGYETSFTPFYPEVDLPKPENGRRGSYTMGTDLHPRSQFSGPVFLPWHFALAQKK